MAVVRDPDLEVVGGIPIALVVTLVAVIYSYNIGRYNVESSSGNDSSN